MQQSRDQYRSKRGDDEKTLDALLIQIEIEQDVNKKGDDRKKYDDLESSYEDRSKQQSSDYKKMWNQERDLEEQAGMGRGGDDGDKKQDDNDKKDADDEKKRQDDREKKRKDDENKDKKKQQDKDAKKKKDDDNKKKRIDKQLKKASNDRKRNKNDWNDNQVFIPPLKPTAS